MAFVLSLSSVAGAHRGEAASCADPGGAEPLSECRRIEQPGHYVLATDIAGAPIEVAADPDPADREASVVRGACIEIVASDVSLDCRGHAVTGSGIREDATAGIYITGRSDSPLHGVRIDGCTVTGHQFGIYAKHVSDTSITASTAARNYETGFRLLAASDTLLAGNTAERNGTDGILVAGGSNVTVAGNLARYNRMRGITVDQGSEGCTVRNNESHGHGVLGFAVYASGDILLEGNNAYDNRYHGFAILHEASSSTFRHNASHHNDRCGFYMEATRGNTFRGNDAHDNALDGIVLFGGAEENRIEANTLRDNGGFGVFGDETIEANSLAGNTFSGNGRGGVGSSPRAEIDFCAYTGFGPEGTCDPVFDGGPNTKDPELRTSCLGGPFPTVAGPEPSSRVGVFYYPWYESKPFDGAWGHWEGGYGPDGATFRFQPPGDVASDFYPALGAYSSQDPAVVARHFACMRQAGIGVVISSWWGPGDYTDRAVPLLLDLAEKYRLKVTFLVEPSSMGSAGDMQSAVEYLLDRYSAHPAFYRTTKTSRRVGNSDPKGAIFVWAAPPPDAAWNRALDALHAGDDAPLILADAPEPALYTESGHYDGVYNYASLHLRDDGFDWARDMPDGTLYVPSVIPGFTSTRNVEGPDDAIDYDRAGGATYEYQWELALGQGVVPWMVTITSWNEWHEGTQIEPAMSRADLPPGTPFRDYGELGPEGYLDITNRWVNTYRDILRGAGDSGGQPCGPAPSAGCRPPAGARLTLRQASGRQARRLAFRWEDRAPDRIDLGDPTDGASYALCVYDARGLVRQIDIPAAGECAAGACWRRRRRGYAFKAGAGSSGEITRAVLSSSRSGSRRIVIRERGPSEARYPLPLTGAVTVQFANRAIGSCVEASFTESAVTASTANGFLARVRRR